MSEDNDRVSVQTYVPQYQGEIWKEEAEEMEMSQAEFVRTMVQAGRNRFDLQPLEKKEQSPKQDSEDKSTIKNRVCNAISRQGPLEWEELIDALTEDIETKLDRALEELQSDNKIFYDGREGGYKLREEDYVE